MPFQGHLYTVIGPFYPSDLRSGEGGSGWSAPATDRKLFHARAAATGNARSPGVDWRLTAPAASWCRQSACGRRPRQFLTSPAVCLPDAPSLCHALHTTEKKDSLRESKPLSKNATFTEWLKIKQPQNNINFIINGAYSSAQNDIHCSLLRAVPYKHKQLLGLITICSKRSVNCNGNQGRPKLTKFSKRWLRFRKRTVRFVCMTKLCIGRHRATVQRHKWWSLG